MRNCNKPCFSQKYVDKGFIDLSDNAAFYYVSDVCNCFGLNYKTGIQLKGQVRHPYIDGVGIWFPKFHDSSDWSNKITPDGLTIYESNRDPNRNVEAVEIWLNDPLSTRYVFSQLEKGGLYHFVGVFKLNTEKTKELHKAVWERVDSQVKTHKII